MAEINSLELNDLKCYSLDNSVDFTALHQLNPKRYPFLLESSAQAENILLSDNNSAIEHARFNILFAFPQNTLTLHSDNALSGSVIDQQSDFLTNLDLNWQEQQKCNIDKFNSHLELPFTGGWFVYLSYELAGQIENRLELPQHEQKSIVAKLTRIPVAIIHDKLSDKQIIIAEADFKEKISEICLDINKLEIKSNEESDFDLTLLEDDPEFYLDAIAKVKQYIKDGDVFQVNLSRQWQADIKKNTDLVGLYRSLRNVNPAPFSAYVDYEELKIISSSPERLIKVQQGQVQTRPIAGTRARKNETNADFDNLKELLSHPKERAEHIMLIDLERNDLGRICSAGSIHVDELMVLESFQHVHHIVSNVCGRLRSDITPGEVIRAVFPGGTITGCPKERCMQIIAELEKVPRGAYTGSLGYINHSGDMDLNILIRTFEVKNNQLLLRAGAGLVADSIAENELQETRAKAKGLIEALA